MYSLFIFLTTLFFLVNTSFAAAPAAAVAPDVMTIMKKTKEAFEPVHPSKRKVTITVNSKGGTVQLIAGQALKKFPDGKRMVLVFLEPASVKGMAYLVCEQKNEPELMFIYLPSLKRVRRLVGFADPYSSFFGTDFTYADLGFINLHKDYRLLGQENHGGIQAYKVETKSAEEKDYYSRIINWIAVDSFLPLQRDYYSTNGQLWKTELFEGVSVINGIPTVLRVKMKEIPSDRSTVLDLSMVEYDIDVPDEIFDPTALSQIADNKCWGEYCPVTIPKK